MASEDLDTIGMSHVGDFSSALEACPRFRAQKGKFLSSVVLIIY